MTEQEMKEHLELQSTTIEEQKTTISTQKDELTKLGDSIKELKKTAVTPEELTKLKEVQTKFTEMETKNGELQGQLDNISLKEKFPAIKDWTLVKGATLAEKEEHAGKLNEALGGKAPEKKPDLDPSKKNEEPVNKGEKFKNVGGPGAPSTEMISEEEKTKKLEGLRNAQKSGDLGAVLDSCIALQPEKANAIGLTSAKK